MKTGASFSLRKFIILMVSLSLSGWAFVRAEPRADLDSVPSKIQVEIHRMMLNGNIPSAAVAIVRGDEIVWSGAFGQTNLWSKAPAFPNSVYLFGSIFKTMSTFALLQQMEAGKFRLDDPVNNFLSEFKIRGDDPANPVTFRHLLTHTSGLPGDFGAYSVWGDSSPLPLRAYLERALQLKRPPLTEVVYSNMAYTLVAYLVQKLSGRPYKKYIEKNIFEPLEMSDTAFAPRPDMVERLAIPYYYDSKSERYKPVGWTKANVWPAGIVYGTVIDLAHWLIANLNRGVYKGRPLISEETFAQVMTKQYPQFSGPLSEGWLNETTGYGLTWWVSDLNGEKIFAHSGSVTGYTAFVAGSLDKKIGIAVLTNGNRAHKCLFELAAKALEIMRGEINAEETGKDR